MIGVVMAGGKASRFGRRVEKGLLEVGGVSLTERAVSALSVDRLDSVAVAVTPHVPGTARLARKVGADVVETSGLGYHADALQLVRDFGRFVSLNVDVPFADKGHVNTLMDAACAGSAAAVVPAELAPSGVDPGSVLVGPDGRSLVWAGLNIVSTQPDTDLVVIEDWLLAININDDEDLELSDRVARGQVGPEGDQKRRIGV